jgi:hypothetical protein
MRQRKEHNISLTEQICTGLIQGQIRPSRTSELRVHHRKRLPGPASGAGGSQIQHGVLGEETQ